MQFKALYLNDIAINPVVFWSSVSQSLHIDSEQFR